MMARMVSVIAVVSLLSFASEMARSADFCADVLHYKYVNRTDRDQVDQLIYAQADTACSSNEGRDEHGESREMGAGGSYGGTSGSFSESTAVSNMHFSREEACRSGRVNTDSFGSIRSSSVNVDGAIQAWEQCMANTSQNTMEVYVVPHRDRTDITFEFKHNAQTGPTFYFHPDGNPEHKAVVVKGGDLHCDLTDGPSDNSTAHVQCSEKGDESFVATVRTSWGTFDAVKIVGLEDRQRAETGYATKFVDQIKDLRNQLAQSKAESDDWHGKFSHASEVARQVVIGDRTYLTLGPLSTDPTERSYEAYCTAEKPVAVTGACDVAHWADNGEEPAVVVGQGFITNSAGIGGYQCKWRKKSSNRNVLFPLVVCEAR